MAFTEVVNVLFRTKGAGKVKRDVRSIRTSLQGAAKAAKAMVGPILGLGAGYMLARTAKATVMYQKRLTQLSIQARISREAQEKLNKQIKEVAMNTGVARDDVLGFVQGIVDATGNMELAKDSMKAVAMAAQVTGADLQGLGTLVADAFMKFGISGKDAMSTLSILIEQGEMGRYTLNEMAQTGARAMSVAGLAGMKGVEGLREMGAMMQIIRQGFGSAEEAATGFKVMVTKIYSRPAQKMLKEMGIALRDPATGKLRKFGDVFLDILKASKGDAEILSQLFGTRGIMGTARFAKIVEEAGGSIEAVEAEIAKFRDTSGEAATLMEKFMRIQETAAVSTSQFKQMLQAFVDDTILSPAVLNNFATSLNWLSQELKDIAGEWRDALGLEKKLTDEQLAATSQAARAAKGGAIGGRGLTAARAQLGAMQVRGAMDPETSRFVTNWIQANMPASERAGIQYTAGGLMTGGGRYLDPVEQLKRLSGTAWYDKLIKSYAEENRLFSAPSLREAQPLMFTAPMQITDDSIAKQAKAIGEAMRAAPIPVSGESGAKSPGGGGGIKPEGGAAKR